MKRFITFLSLFILSISLSHAAVTVNFVESGSDVVATATGTVNTAGLSVGGGSTNNASFVKGTGFINPSDGGFGIGNTPATLDGYTGITHHVFSTGSVVTASIDSGDYIAISQEAVGDTLRVPTGYVSGTVLNSSATWLSKTIADLGLIPGTYVFSWGSGGDADSLTLFIAGSAPNTYTVSGTVSGLTDSVTLQNNGGDDIVKTTNDGFTFPAQAEGADYAVTVSSQPAGQTCTVSNGTGTNISADIDNVAVSCVDNVVIPPPAGPVTPIPTMSVWGLGIFITLMGIIGFNRRRKI